MDLMLTPMFHAHIASLGSEHQSFSQIPLCPLTSAIFQAFAPRIPSIKAFKVLHSFPFYIQ